MDTLQQIFTPLAGLPAAAISTFLISVVTVLVVFKWIVLRDAGEEPVKYSVPIPEQCNPAWRGETLREPNIKVAYDTSRRVGDVKTLRFQ